MGRTLVKFGSLPTTSGWPTPVWTIDPLYTGSGSSQFAYASSFAVSGSSVGVAFFVDNSIFQGYVLTYNATDGSLGPKFDPVLSNGTIGYFDNMHSIEGRNGWFWVQDDWYTGNVGICPSEACR